MQKYTVTTLRTPRRSPEGFRPRMAGAAHGHEKGVLMRRFLVKGVLLGRLVGGTAHAQQWPPYNPPAHIHPAPGCATPPPVVTPAIPAPARPAPAPAPQPERVTTPPTPDRPTTPSPTTPS